MTFNISEKAANHYISEIGLHHGDHIRLFVRVGGCGSGGFSVGVTKDQPSTQAIVQNVLGVNFFVEEEDFWYVNGMCIDFDEDLKYVIFENNNFKDLDNP